MCAFVRCQAHAEDVVVVAEVAMLMHVVTPSMIVDFVSTMLVGRSQYNINQHGHARFVGLQVLVSLVGWPAFPLLQPPPGGRGILVRVQAPPCQEFQGFQFDPTFLWSSLVLLPIPIAFSVILFLLLAYSPALYFPKSCLFER